jgi:hypothetical protein
MGKKGLFRHRGKSSFPAMGRALSIFAVFLVLAGMVHGMEHAAHFGYDDAQQQSHYAEDDCLAAMLSADIEAEAHVSFVAWPNVRLAVSHNVAPQGGIITGFCARAPPHLI